VTSDLFSIEEPESNLVSVQASVNGRKIANAHFKLVSVWKD
jgi:hypothetical protein